MAGEPEEHDGEAGRASSGLDAQVAERRAKRQAVRDAGADPYPTRFDRSATLAELRAAYGELAADERSGEQARVAGRVVSVRGHGKLKFLTLRDSSGTVQLMAQETRISAPGAATLELVDMGDWIGVEGEVVASRRGELSVDVDEVTLLAKALRPLPDKWHGLNEQETRYRQREVDLLANDESRRVFEVRFATIASMRRSLTEQGFVEVETPILQPQAGGALARPFVTHANALDADLTLRIAPELYLKRLVVGGMERVFEVARNFRNEGIDTRHSPEFTSLEAYQAFGDVNDGMDLTEHIVATAGPRGDRPDAVRGGRDDGRPHAAVAPPLVARPSRGPSRHPGRAVHAPAGGAGGLRRARGRPSSPTGAPASWSSSSTTSSCCRPRPGRCSSAAYPIEVSPLARHNRQDPTMADRFELVVGGRELANGYSELNDPDEQAQRFGREAAAAAAGDLEAHPADQAFVRALEYGLPPTSGIGIGIDRLIMVFAEVASIRDVILFPTLRPEAGP